jgi:hypothetical protein
MDWPLHHALQSLEAGDVRHLEVRCEQVMPSLLHELRRLVDVRRKFKCAIDERHVPESYGIIRKYDPRILEFRVYVCAAI